MKMTSRMRMRRSLRRLMCGCWRGGRRGGGRRFVRRSESMLPRFAVGESGKTS
jgi:hypothetical protein